MKHTLRKKMKSKKMKKLSRKNFRGGFNSTNLAEIKRTVSANPDRQWVCTLTPKNGGKIYNIVGAVSINNMAISTSSANATITFNGTKVSIKNYDITVDVLSGAVSIAPPAVSIARRSPSAAAAVAAVAEPIYDEATELRLAIDESLKTEKYRQTRIVGDIQVLDQLLPSTNISFRQFGAFLMPSRNTGDPHSTFDSMTNSAAALTTLEQSCSQLQPIPNASRRFSDLTYSFILGNASGINENLLNNPAYLKECCVKLATSLDTYMRDNIFDVQGQVFNLGGILSNIVIFITRIMPENFPNKQQSMENMFQEVLQDSATANTDERMTLATPTANNWSCSRGTFERILIHLGSSINKHTNTRPLLTVGMINALDQTFFIENLRQLERAPNYYTRTDAVILEELIQRIINEYVREGILQLNSPVLNDIQAAIRAKCQAFITVNIQAFRDFASGIKKRTRKQKKSAKR